MIWTTSEIEYDGLPLLLRKPDHINVWRFKSTLTRLLCVEHILNKVSPDGLPEKQYNSTLSEFDHHMCSVFDNSSEGIIFLIETYGGKRSYYYYTTPNFISNSLIEIAKQQFEVKLESWSQEDIGWGFLDDYPVTLFTD